MFKAQFSSQFLILPIQIAQHFKNWKKHLHLISLQIQFLQCDLALFALLSNMKSLVIA